MSTVMIRAVGGTFDESEITDVLDAVPELAAIVQAAKTVVLNAKGATPRHTRARSGGCRDDCIPCGLATLDRALETFRRRFGLVEAMDHRDYSDGALALREADRQDAGL